jgi:hypothetical protein
MQIHEDAAVTGVKMTLQLVENGCLPGPPLPVEHDWRVAMAPDQVPLDKGENVRSAIEHLGARNWVSRDIGIYRLFGIQVRLA